MNNDESTNKNIFEPPQPPQPIPKKPLLPFKVDLGPELEEMASSANAIIDFINCGCSSVKALNELEKHHIRSINLLVGEYRKAIGGP